MSTVTEPKAAVAPPSTRLWQLAALNAVASVFLLVSFGLTGIGQVTEAGCTTQILDFHVFWSAGRLAADGMAQAALDPAVLNAGFNACTADWMPWLHPPPALAFMTPFGLLPLVPAWFAFNAVALTALGTALVPFAPSPWLLAVVLAPAFLPALLAGQFTLLWIAGFLAALHALRTERWVWAGVLIACLTLKPTLGLLIPVALLAMGAWRTIFAASVSTILLHGLATMFYGAAYWPKLLALYQTLGDTAAGNPGALTTMTSVTAFLSRLGMSPDTGLLVNLALALVLAAVVFVVWRRLGVRSDAAVAVLAAAIPLASPYLWHYDSAFLVITALFLLRQTGFRPGGMTAVLCLLFWMGAGLSVWLNATTITTALPPLLVVPPLFGLAFAASLYHSIAGEKEGR